MLVAGAVAGIVVGCVIVTNTISIAVTWYLTRRHFKKQGEKSDPDYDLPPDSNYPIQQHSPVVIQATSNHVVTAPLPSPRRSTFNVAQNAESSSNGVFENHAFYDDTVDAHGTSSGHDVTRASGPKLPGRDREMTGNWRNQVADDEQGHYTNTSRSVEDLSKAVEDEEHYITYKTEDDRARAMSHDLSKAIAARREAKSSLEVESDDDYEHLEPAEVTSGRNTSPPPPGSYVAAQNADNAGKPRIMPKPKRMQNQL